MAARAVPGQRALRSHRARQPAIPAAAHARVLRPHGDGHRVSERVQDMQGYFFFHICHITSRKLLIKTKIIDHNILPDINIQRVTARTRKILTSYS